MLTLNQIFLKGFYMKVIDEIIDGQMVRRYDYSDNYSNTGAEEALNAYFSKSSSSKKGFVRVSSGYMKQKYGYNVPELYIDTASGIVYIYGYSSEGSPTYTPLLKADGMPLIIDFSECVCR